MAEIAAARLQGTGGSITGLGEEFEALENDAEFCAHLDQLVFCCEECGWWCEQGEMAEEDPEGLGRQICDDCAPASCAT